MTTTPTLHLTDLIDADRVVLNLRARDKKQLLAALADKASRHAGPEASVILAALTAREALGSTGFGRGFALPHVRLDGLDRASGLLVRLAKPVNYEAIDGQPVDVLFLLMIPATRTGDSVAPLAAVSRAMRDEGRLAAIRRATDPVDLLKSLADA